MFIDKIEPKNKEYKIKMTYYNSINKKKRMFIKLKTYLMATLELSITLVTKKTQVANLTPIYLNQIKFILLQKGKFHKVN